MEYGYRCLWDLVDQTFLTIFTREHPEVQGYLDCSWNVQTSMFWFHKYHNSSRECNQQVNILHANWPQALKEALAGFLIQPHTYAINRNLMRLRSAMLKPEVRKLCEQAPSSHFACNASYLVSPSALEPLRARDSIRAANEGQGSSVAPL